jgi:hypothetical protein
MLMPLMGCVGGAAVECSRKRPSARLCVIAFTRQIIDQSKARCAHDTASSSACATVAITGQPRPHTQCRTRLLAATFEVKSVKSLDNANLQ